MQAAGRVTVPGSERTLDPAHRRLSDVDGGQQIEVTVYVRARAAPDWVDEAATRSPAQRRILSRDEWADAHGADDADLNAVAEFAHDNGLDSVSVESARRAVILRGSVDSVTAAFEADLLGLFEHPTGVHYRGRQGGLTVPTDLDGIVTGVFGIDDRPQAQPRIRFATEPAASYTPVQVGQAYDFPPGATGVGERVGIIELGGGYDTTDLTAYFDGLGLTTPSISSVSVDGGTNSPGVDTNADGEVMLDIEVVGSVAPSASIVVYFAPNTDQGFLDAISMAVHDTTNSPSVISISWGGPEDSWTSQARAQMEQTLTAAGGLGVTVTSAAGDGGSTDGVDDGQQHVDFPASAPHALACGGTSLQASGSQITDETVWNDAEGATGGGVSVEFALPSYQAQAGVPDNVDTGEPRSRRPGRRRRRRPGDRLHDPSRRRRPGDRRHERRRAVVGRLGRLAQPVARVTARIRPARGSTAPRAFMTSPAATTAPTTPAPAGTPAPASARPTARRCCRRCRAAQTARARLSRRAPRTTSVDRGDRSTRPRYSPGF